MSVVAQLTEILKKKRFIQLGYVQKMMWYRFEHQSSQIVFMWSLHVLIVYGFMLTVNENWGF